MSVKVVWIIALLSVVSCEPPSSHYGAPLNSYGAPSFHGNNYNNHDHSEPKSYEFGYQVKDEYSGNNYKRQEASDGNNVQGEYRVQLPDGRTQIVTYRADWQTGFHADVRYEGQASYPESSGHGSGFGGRGYGSGGYAGGSYNSLHTPSNQYGAPGVGSFNHGGAATSSVSIKDYSGPGTPYNVGGHGGGYSSGGSLGGYSSGGSLGGFGGYGNGHGFNNLGGFDSYSNAAGFGHKIRPSATYGAP